MQDPQKNTFPIRAKHIVAAPQRLHTAALLDFTQSNKTWITKNIDFFGAWNSPLCQALARLPYKATK